MGAMSATFMGATFTIAPLLPCMGATFTMGATHCSALPRIAYGTTADQAEVSPLSNPSRKSSPSSGREKK
jgi:hypothetical protein